MSTESEVLTLGIDINDNPLNQKLDAVEQKITSFKEKASPMLESAMNSNIPGYGEAMAMRYEALMSNLDSIYRTRKAIDHSGNSVEREDLTAKYRRQIEMAERTIADMFKSTDTMKGLTDGLGKKAVPVFTKGISEMMRDLGGAFKHFASELVVKIGNSLTDDELVRRFMGSKDYQKIIAPYTKRSADVFSDANMSKLLHASLTTVIPQHMRPQLVGNSAVKFRAIPNSFDEMLPESFRRMSVVPQTRRKISAISTDNPTISQQEFQDLDRLVRNKRWAADAAVAAGIYSKLNGKLYYNPKTTYDNISAMGGFAMEGLVRAAGGESKYGTSDVRSEKAWKSISKKIGNNNELDNNLDVMRGLHDIFGASGRFRPGYYEPTAFEHAKTLGVASGPIKHGTRTMSNPYAEYTLEMLRGGAYVNGKNPVVNIDGKWVTLPAITGPAGAKEAGNKTGRAITVDDFHTVPMRTSMLSEMVRATHPDRQVGHNEFSDDMIYVKYPREFSNPYQRTEEEKQEFQKLENEIAGYFANGYSPTGKNGPKYIHTRSGKTHMEFMKEDIVDDLGRFALGVEKRADESAEERARIRHEGLKVLANGAGEGHFFSEKDYSKAEYNKNLLATEGESLESWWGTKFGFAPNAETERLLKEAGNVSEVARRKIMREHGTPNVRVVVGNFKGLMKDENGNPMLDENRQPLTVQTMDGQNWIDASFANESFQGRTYGGKATFSRVSLNALKKRYPQLIRENAITAQKISELDKNAADYEKQKQSIISEYGDFLIPKAAANGVDDLLVSYGTQIVESVDNIKNKDLITRHDAEGNAVLDENGKPVLMSQAEINERRSRDYSDKKIFAKTTYDAANSSSRWLSKQIVNSAMAFGFRDPIVSNYFNDVLLGEVAKLNDEQYLRNVVFGGDQTVDLNSKEARTQISNHIGGIFERYREGERLMPAGVYNYGMAAAFPTNVINDAIERAGGTLTPEQQAFALSSSGVNPEVLTMQNLAGMLGIIRFPATAGGNISAVNRAAEYKDIKEAIGEGISVEDLLKNKTMGPKMQRIVNDLQLDPKGFYLAAGSPILEAMQSEDFDGDLNGYFGIDPNNPNAKSFAGVMGLAIRKQQEGYEALLKAADRTPEEQAKIKEALTQHPGKRPGGYSIFNPQDSAHFASMVSRDQALMGVASRGDDLMALISEEGITPDLAKAILDFESMYDVVSVQLKSHDKWNLSEQQNEAIKRGKSFTKIAKKVHEAANETIGKMDGKRYQVFNQDSLNKLAESGIDAYNLPSINEIGQIGQVIGGMRAKQMGLSDDIRGEYGEKVFDYDSIFQKLALPESVKEGSRSEYFVRGVRSLRAGIENHEFVGADKETLAELQKRAELAKAEIKLGVANSGLTGQAAQDEIDKQWKAIGGEAFDEYVKNGYHQANVEASEARSKGLKQLTTWGNIDESKVFGGTSRISAQTAATAMPVVEPQTEKPVEKPFVRPTGPENGVVSIVDKVPNIKKEETEEQETARLLHAAVNNKNKEKILLENKDAIEKALASGSLESLTKLSGIGEATAQKAIDALQSGKLAATIVTSAEEMKKPVETVPVQQIPELKEQKTDSANAPKNLSDAELLQRVQEIDRQLAKDRYNELVPGAQEFSKNLYGNIQTTKELLEGTPSSIAKFDKTLGIASAYESKLKEFKESDGYSTLQESEKRDIERLLDPNGGLVAKAGRDFSLKSMYGSQQLAESLTQAESKANGSYDAQVEALEKWDKKILEVQEDQKRLLEMSQDPKYSKELQNQFKQSADKIGEDLTKINQSRLNLGVAMQSENQKIFDRQIENLENKLHPGSKWHQQSVQYRQQIDNIRESLTKKHDSGRISDADYNKDMERLKRLEKQSSTTALQMKQSFKGVSQSISRSVSNLITRFGRQLFQKALTEAKKFVKEFDKSMTTIQMITLKTDSQMSKLGDGLIAQAKNLKVSISEVTKAAEALYRQGLSDKEVEERLDVITKFSVVSGAKIDAATKLVTVAMNTGLVTDPRTATDIVTALGDNAATNAVEIEKGIEKAGAAAAADGTSFAELAAMLTAITSTTQIGGNVAGRTLNTIFGRMNKIGTNELVVDENGNMISGSDIAKLLQNQGIKLYDDQGNKRSSYDVLNDLSKKWDSMSDAEQQQIAAAIAGTRQYSNFAAIMQGMSEGKVDEYMKLAGESEGIVEEKYDTYAKSLEASFADLKNTFDSIIHDLIDSGALKDIVGFLKDVITGIGGIIKAGGGLPALIAMFGALAVASAAIKGGIAGAAIMIGTLAAVGIAAAVGGGIRASEVNPKEEYKNYIDKTSNINKKQDEKLDRLSELGHKENRTKEEDRELVSLARSVGSYAGTTEDVDKLTSSIRNLGNVASSASSDVSEYTDNIVKEARNRNNQERLAQFKTSLSPRYGSGAAVQGMWEDYEAWRDEMNGGDPALLSAFNEFKGNRDVASYVNYDNYDPVNAILIARDNGKTIDENVRKKYLNAVVDYAYGAIKNGYYTDPLLETKYSDLSEADAKGLLYKALANGRPDSQEFQAITGLLPTDFSNATSRDVLSGYNNDKIKEIFKANVVSILEQNKNNLPISPDAIDAWAEWFTNDYFQTNDDFETPYELPSVQDFSNALYNAWGFDKPYEDVVKTAQDRAVEGGYQLTTNDLLARSNLDEVGETGYFVDRKTGRILSPEEAIALTNEYNTKIEELKSDKYKQKGYYYIDKNGRKVFRGPTGEFFTSEGDARKTYYTLHPSEARFGSLKTGTMSLDHLLASEIEATRPDLIGYKDYVLGSSSNGYISWQQDKSNNNKILADKMLREIYSFRSSEGYGQARGNTDLEKWFWHANTNNLAEWDYLVRNNPELGRILAQVKRDQYGNILNSAEDQDRIFREAQDYLLKSGKDYGARTIQTQEKGQLAMQAYEGLTSGSWFASQEARNQAIQEEYDTYYRNTLKTIPEDVLRNARQMGYENTLVPSIDQYAADKGLIYATDEAKAYLSEIVGPDLARKIVSRQKLSDSEQLYVNRKLDNAQYGLTELTSRNRLSGIKEVRDAIRNGQTIGFNEGQYSATAASQYLTGWGDYNEYVALISKRQMRPDEFTEADAKRLEELNLSLENFQKNAEITVEIEGVKQLEEAGEIAAGVSSELEKLRKGGKVAIDVLLQYRTEAFTTGQQSAKLYGGTVEEQDEAAMAILGMNREQYYANRTENLARARKTEQQERTINARTWQERYEGATTGSQRAEILEDARAAGYDYFGYTLPSGYSVDEFGVVYDENNRPNYEETQKRRAIGFKYVGGVDIGNVGSLAGQSRNYSELEKANALSNILSGGMVRTVGENGNASLFDEAVGYAGERTRELLRQWQNSETNLNFKEWLDQNNIPEEDRALVLAETELARKSATEADALERARLNSTSLGGMFNYRQVQYGQSNKGALAANRLIGVLGSANVASFADLNELVNDNRREDWKDLIESSDELSKKLREMGVAIDANGNIDFSAVKENGYSAAEVLNVLKEAASGASDSLKGFSEVLSTGDVADRAERYFRGEFITQEGREAFANYIGNENIANIVGNNANEYKARSDEWREYNELTPEEKALWHSMTGYAPSDPGEYNPFAGLEGENLEYANRLYENARYGQQGLSELDRLRGFQSAIVAAREGTLADFRAQDSVGYYKDYVGAVSGGEEYLQDIERLHNAGIDFADVKAGKVAYEELEKALGTEEAQRFLQTQKDIDAELEGSFIKASKKAGEYTDAFADSTMKLSKRGVTARKELARLTEEAKDYQDAITVAEKYRGKTGAQIAGDEVAVKQFGRLGFKKEDVESWGKEEAERYSSLLEDTVNEEFAQQNLAPALNEALSRAYELNPTVTIDTFVDANGNLDLSALASFLDGVAPEVASMLRMYDGIIAESAIKLETTTGKDGLPVIQVVQESLGGTRLKSGYSSGGGGYNHKGSGGGGGKSAVDKLLEDLKRKISEIEHQSKLLEIDEKYYDFVNDYGGYTVNIDDQIANQERLRAAYAANISEMNAMLAKTAQGSDDWYKLKDAIMSAEEAMESIKNTINDLNQKRIGILEQKQANEDKPDTHASTMLQKMAARYQKNGRFENYEAIMNQNIDVMRQEVNQNNKQIKEWEDLLRTYREGSDSWIETRDKIWALKEENAELENQMASDIIDLQEARIAQIAKDLENAQSPLEHANNMLETYGSMFESTGNQAGLRNTLQSTIDNNTRLKTLNDEAIEELKKQINAMKESDPARESAISTLYQLEEASAQYEASILSNRQAIEESYINEIIQGHADSGAILEHEMKLLSEAEKKFLHDNDFVNYENIVKEEARNTADRLEEQRNALADYLELQESGRITEGSQQWRTLEETIRSTKENIASLSNEYDDWIAKLQTTRFENLQRSFTESDDLAQHNLRMIQYEETRYQNNGQLANYGILLAQDNEMQKDRAASISRYLDDLREQLEAAEDNPDLYKRIRSEITKYEEQLSQTNNTIEKNTDLLHKNEEAIRKVRQAVENTIDKEIRARIQKQRDMLAATVSIENTILDVIRKNYQEQWKLQKADIDKKKQALNEEKNLINERLNARKKAMSEETKYEELAEYQRQLALIAADPTRTKEANELRRKIKDLSKDISMDIATDQANAQAEAIDDQIKAMDNYVATYEEDLNEMLSDANNFREDLDEIMGGSFDEFVAWMQEHNEGYNLATAETRRQMEQGWEDTWKKMKGELDTYWQEVDESMRTREGFLEYMQNSDTYKSASESGQQSLLAYWGDMYDDYTASLIKDANFDHTHDILNKIDELQDWEFKVRPIGIEDYFINMGYSDYTYNRDKSVDPYNPYDNYEGVGYVAPPPAPSTGGGGGSSGGSGSGSGGGTGGGSASSNFVNWANSSTGNLLSGFTTYDVVANSNGAYGVVEVRGINGRFSTKDAAQAYADKMNLFTLSQKLEDRGFDGTNVANVAEGVLAIVRARTKTKEQNYSKYAEGGLVDFTGPAWVDGTKARPESFLDATDTKLLRDMLDSFNYVSQKPFISQIDQKGITGQSVNVGDVNVNLYEAKLESDADYDLIAKKVGSAFTKEIQKTGLNLSAYAF